jgi:hypothetical protein
MYQVIGTCSLCGGRVSVGRWGFVALPASCESCGAVAAMHGPVIPMVPRSAAVYVPVQVSPTVAPAAPWPWRGWEVTCGATS